MREAIAPNAGEFAERAGMTRATLGRVEHEQGPVRVDAACNIAAALGVEPPQHLGRAVWVGRSTAGRPSVQF